MKELIPFETIESLLIEKGIYKPNKGKQGRPSISVNILVGALFLQSWYGLSDPMTEELIHDRISFRKFLDIKEEDTIPDETTICKFRNALIKNNLLESIFKEVKNSMIEKNLILNEGTLVDATLIHSSEPKRKKDENGKTFYLTKNSYGAGVGPYAGYLHMSRNYVRMKTIYFMVHKDAIPADIRAKVSLK